MGDVADIKAGEMPVLFVTTRQARTIHAMPGTLILEARRRMVEWRGKVYVVTD